MPERRTRCCLRGGWGRDGSLWELGRERGQIPHQRFVGAWPCEHLDSSPEDASRTSDPENRKVRFCASCHEVQSHL